METEVLMKTFLLPLINYSHKIANTLAGSPEVLDPESPTTSKEIEIHWWDYLLFLIYFVFTIANLTMLIKYIQKVMTLTAFIMTTNLLANICKFVILLSHFCLFSIE